MGGVAALVCAIAFALLMLALAAVTLKLARTLSITNRMLNDVRREAVPLLSKLQTTMDHVNEEMVHVDGVLKSLQQLAGRANAVTKAAERVLTSPLVRILSLGVGAQRALGAASSGEKGGRGGEKD